MHGIVVNGKQETEKVLQITANPVHSFRMSDLLNGTTSLVIQPCDTSWAVLCNRAFGDPKYGDILEVYSGMPLIPGQSINLIQTLNAYNKAQDFTPYERLMSAIYNSMNPAVKTPQPPPPPPPHHESFWDELIGVVIAVVVMIVAPEAIGALAFGAAFSAAGLATLGAGQLAVAFAVGGALADAATQGVAISFDDQHGFSVQSMVENAVAAGATAGLTKALNIQGLLTEKNPEYCLAFAESVGVGMTVQLFQLSIGLRDKLDIKFILEQAAASVLQAAINRGLPKAPKPLTDLVDEFENTGVSAAFGQKPDLTALAGNYLGDEAGDTADLIAQHIRQSHHTTSIGKSSKPSHYSTHAHAHHADSRYTPDAVQQDDGIGDLYDAFKSRLQGDVNEIAESNFTTAMSSASSSGRREDVSRVQHLECHATWKTKLENEMRGMKDFASDSVSSLKYAAQSFWHHRVVFTENVVGGATQFLADQVNEAEYLATGGYLGNPAAITRNEMRGEAIVNYLSALAHSHFGTAEQGYLIAEGGSWLIPSATVGKVSELGLNAIEHGVAFARRGATLFNFADAEKPVGLTSRLNRAQISDYLTNVHRIPREQLLKDLESVGFKLKGESPSGLFRTYEDKMGNLRVKIHPPDSSTGYSHMHIYDKIGNSLTPLLFRDAHDSPNVHIEIYPIQKELEWRSQ